MNTSNGPGVCIEMNHYESNMHDYELTTDAPKARMAALLTQARSDRDALNAATAAVRVIAGSIASHDAKIRQATADVPKRTEDLHVALADGSDATAARRALATTQQTLADLTGARAILASRLRVAEAGETAAKLRHARSYAALAQAVASDKQAAILAAAQTLADRYEEFFAVGMGATIDCADLSNGQVPEAVDYTSFAAINVGPDEQGVKAILRTVGIDSTAAMSGTFGLGAGITFDELLTVAEAYK